MRRSACRSTRSAWRSSTSAPGWAAGGDKSLLAVEGALVNLRGRETAAPSLRIALRAADGRELYVWTARAPKDRLGPGEREPFVARLASPPPGAVDALVKFVAPSDKDSLAPEG